MSSHLNLAKKAVKLFIEEGKVISPPKNLPPELLDERAGVFVTIKNKGKLRGCIGTFLPTKENVAEEIISNAVAACSRDLRFPRIKEGEFSELSFEIYLLEKPEKVEKIEELDPRTYGILVRSGLKSGLLLPGLEGIGSGQEQIGLACRKAGINPKKEPFQIFKFEAKKYEEE